MTHQTELCCFETQTTRKCRDMPLSNFMIFDLEIDSEAQKFLVLRCVVYVYCCSLSLGEGGGEGGGRGETWSLRENSQDP